MPAFRFNGKPVVAFAAWANHHAFYPGTVAKAFKEELKDYDTNKGTFRFRADNPLPATLVRKLVKARIVENAIERE